MIPVQETQCVGVSVHTCTLCKRPGKRPVYPPFPDTHILTYANTQINTKRHVGIELQWSGTGVDEIGTDKATGIVRVQVNPKFFRPAEVEFLLGNAAKVIDFFVCV